MDDEALDGRRGTALGAVDDDADGRFHDVVNVDWRGDSESEALSHASSSPHSAVAEK